MFETNSKNKMTAVVVVALFILSAFAVMLAPVQADSDGDYTNKGFTINMRVDDTFSYTPKSNLDDTKFSWEIPQNTLSNSDVLSYNQEAKTFAQGASISYTPKASGNLTFVLNAVWEKDGLRQTATQTIHVLVLDRIAVTNTDNFTDTINLSANSAQSSNLKTYVLTGGNGTASFTAPAVYSDYDEGTDTGTPSQGVITAAISNNSLVLGNADNPAQGVYYVVTTASYDYDSKFVNTDVAATSATESKRIVITVVVGDGLGLEKTHSSTVIGLEGETAQYSTGNPFVVTVINDDAVTDLEISKGALDTASSTGWASDVKRDAYHSETIIVQGANHSNSAIVNLPTQGWSNEDLAGQSAKMVFNVSLDANDGEGNPINTVNVPYTLTVYYSLAFTTTPVNQSVSLYSSSNNGLNVLLTATVLGAKTLMYDWGDNSPATPVEISGTDNTFITATHTYAKAGTYFVRVIASNDFGDSVFITPYTTGTNFMLDTNRSITAGDVQAQIEGDDITLTGHPEVTGEGDHSEIAFKWSYKEPGMSAYKLITPSDKPAFVKSVDNALVMDKNAIKSGTVFSLVASTVFEDDDDPMESEPSTYTFTVSGDFFAEHGWLFIIFLILTILGLIAIFYFGYQVIQVYVLTIVFAILAIALFFCKDFGGVWDAIAGLFGAR